MSHLTHMKTQFQNLFYLEKALNTLSFKYKKKLLTQNSKVSLVIPQPNGHDLEFFWNGQEYELRVDISFWQQACPIKNFIDKIAQKYASEVVAGETQKIGFTKVKYDQNLDGSNTLVLERWRY